MSGLLGYFGALRDPTGYEQQMADKPAGNTSIPETVTTSLMQVAGMKPAAFKNYLLGGDFSTNPWQRGTSFAAIANTLTYTADRWFALGGASSSIAVSQQANTESAGTGHALRFQRTAANADTAVIALGQALTTSQSRQLQGKQVVLSFRAKAGANYSPVGGQLDIVIASGTGTDGSAANLVAGSWTGYAAAQLSTAAFGSANVGGGAAGNPSGVQDKTLLSNVSGVQVTTADTLYQVTAAIPATAVQVGVLFRQTPVGTAGTNDWVELKDIQLEVVAPLVPYATLFERRSAVTERMLCQHFYYQLNEKGTAAAVQANGMISATNVQTICIKLPVQMRTTPTVGVTAGAFRFNIAGTLTAVGAGFAAGTAATQSPDAINVVGAVTATVGQATQLVSGASTWGGSITASAEL